MCMINCCVFDRSISKTLLPWRILAVENPGTSVEQFFEQKILQEVEKIVQNPLNAVELESAFIGRSKDSLDRIELSLELERAAAIFGPFLKYHVREQPQQAPSRNAFSIMMQTSQLLSQPRLPTSITERNKKDKLYNDFLKQLEDDDVTFPSSELTSGKSYIRAMVDCLWYLDSHHDVLNKQSCPIPAYFIRYNGYSTPELSKHRKRDSSNLSGSTLETMASTLFHLLQKSFWSLEQLKPLYKSTEDLSEKHCIIC